MFELGSGRWKAIYSGRDIFDDKGFLGTLNRKLLKLIYRYKIEQL
jgi:hypothetical protein